MTHAASPSPSSLPPQARIVLPDVPVLVAGVREAVVLTPEGEVSALLPKTAATLARKVRPMVCHAPALQARLGGIVFPAHDVLELFAFAHPARFCLPTVAGLCATLALPIPKSLEHQAAALVDCVQRLLHTIATLPDKDRRRAQGTAWTMALGGWAWGASVLAALGVEGEAPHRGSVISALRVWDHLPEISEFASQAPPGSQPVDPAEARSRLGQLLGTSAEDRPQQADFASACSAAFAPREVEGVPHVVLAEAGTGVGKTLGYIAPASVWAEKNEGTVWISTYTRNLQRQLDGELSRLHPDPHEKARRVVVRKGRENYLCLLNLEEAVNRLSSTPDQAVALGLMVRWAGVTRDGDMGGGDFPGWLADLLGRPATQGLMDRRGECVFSACPHYNRCFIERAIRRARRARIVVANHALVMVTAALGGAEDGTLPTRVVFDEGHHLFDAADSAFSAHLTGLETAELRRWLLGAEEVGRSRARGLKRRAEEVIGSDPDTLEALDATLRSARCLPGPSWHARLSENLPHGPTEQFLSVVRTQVLARTSDTKGPYSLECDTHPLAPGLEDTAATLHTALGELLFPLKDLCRLLAERLSGDEAAELDAATRLRIEGLVRSLERRAIIPVSAWRSMLAALRDETPPQFVDWMALDRQDGRDIDIGLHRHWIDPTDPLAQSVTSGLHGVLVTSATLRDGSGDEESDWRGAETMTGGRHLPAPPIRAAVASPFAYPDLTRVVIVTDVRKDDLAQVSAAYRELFLAAGGGALGLFTAISRLRAVREAIAAPLDEAGLPLYAQHVDGMDTGTLIDIFRAEEDACLLGTDAVRDGVDIPGRSLRLIVFDRVPWPRPDILHRARRSAFGGRTYDDRITRLRLKQAFGRLVRRAGDRGTFVLLDPMMPSRLFGAFPPGVAIERVGLAEAARIVREMGV